LVTRVVHGSSAYGTLQEGDVILDIEHALIACDGSVALEDLQRVRFTHLINMRQIGDIVDLGILRNGQVIRLALKLGGPVSLVPVPTSDRMLSYFIMAGLVFVRLTQGYISTWGWEQVD
jgi:hypothetical protein